MLRLTKLLCVLSALTLLASCGGGTSTLPPPPVLSIATPSLPDGFVMFAYGQTIQAKGGVTPFTWAVSSGSLPHNLALGSSSTSSVILSGTPDAAQSAATFTIRVTDAKNQSAAKSYSIDINSVASAQLQEVPGPVPADTVEIQGVGAGSFNPGYWQQNTLHWVPDTRAPMFAPLTTGPYQNIYAPWPLEQTAGWRMFYGGWDGTDTPFDQVNSVTTTDFLTFDNRDHVIANGAFLNVNNVNVRQLSDGSLHMICTGGQPGNSGGDKPVYFSSPDGIKWNGTPEPYAAQLTDVISIQGYAAFDSGNFNGANVLLRDNGTWVLYFSDWQNDPQTIHRATADTLPNFQLQGSALNTDHAVNDVKKFVVNGTSWYLMGLHHNEQSLWYSLSNDGITFASQQVLLHNLSGQDQYIVAVGFVTRSTQLLGILYGASSVVSLDQNQIFARWLQKKVLITDSSNVQYLPQGGYGPDRQWFRAPGSGSITGTINVYAEDAVTPLASGSVNVIAGKAYRLVLSGGP